MVPASSLVLLALDNGDGKGGVAAADYQGESLLMFETGKLLIIILGVIICFYLDKYLFL